MAKVYVFSVPDVDLAEGRARDLYVSLARGICENTLLPVDYVFDEMEKWKKAAKELAKVRRV